MEANTQAEIASLRERLAALEANLAAGRTPFQNEEPIVPIIRRMLDEGLRAWTIAQALGTTQNRVCYLARKYGFPIQAKRPRLELSQVEDLVAVLEHGPVTDLGAATAVGFSPKTVRVLVAGEYESTYLGIPEDLQLRLFAAADNLLLDD